MRQRKARIQIEAWSESETVKVTRVQFKSKGDRNRRQRETGRKRERHVGRRKGWERHIGRHRKPERRSVTARGRETQRDRMDERDR